MDYLSELDSVKENLQDMKMYFYNQKGKQEQLLEQKVRLESLLENTLRNMDILDKVRMLLQQTTDIAREQSRKEIESIVTNCLQFIFDTDIEFSIEVHEVRGKAEAEFYVLSRKGDMIIRTRPQEARGGGIVDIISLAVRIAMLQSTNPPISGPLILDEPAKHVSEEYIFQVGEFLKQVSRMFDRQIIMVTHNRHLSETADKIYRIEMRNGISYIASSEI